MPYDTPTDRPGASEAEAADSPTTPEVTVAAIATMEPQPATPTPTPPPMPTPGGDEDLVGNLMQLATLRQQGFLTEDEFSMAKAKVLHRRGPRLVSRFTPSRRIVGSIHPIGTSRVVLSQVANGLERSAELLRMGDRSEVDAAVDGEIREIRPHDG